jgi:hypothetical protein
MGREVLSNRLDLAIIGAGGQSLICMGAVYFS